MKRYLVILVVMMSSLALSAQTMIPVATQGQERVIACKIYGENAKALYLPNVLGAYITKSYAARLIAEGKVDESKIVPAEGSDDVLEKGAVVTIESFQISDFHRGGLVAKIVSDQELPIVFGLDLLKSIGRVTDYGDYLKVYRNIETLSAEQVKELIAPIDDYVDQGNHSAVIDILTLVESGSTITWRGLMTLVLSYNSIGEYGELLTATDWWINNYSEEADEDITSMMYGYMGDAYLYFDYYEGALSSYDSSLELASSQDAVAVAKIRLGSLYSMLGYHASAINMLRVLVSDIFNSLEIKFEAIENGEVDNNSFVLALSSYASALHNEGNLEDKANAAMYIASKCGSENAARFCSDNNITSGEMIDILAINMEELLKQQEEMIEAQYESEE